MNPAVSFALWITGKSSNRRFACYLFVHSIIAVLIVDCMFVGNQHEIYAKLMVSPRDNHDMSAYFFTEFALTFALTFVAFTVAFEEAEANKPENLSFQSIADAQELMIYSSTPQSRTGFAPIAIGFIVFSLNLVGGKQ